ncbi:VOC family protein [Thaumasiovibrio subtropicus]|uniref:VOC family protein n=1 Tax=Thaumasiovibrio subtropicus TaxID=1891207 RepID=UPI000B356E88|nr:VOC family protein [Thaumasiovibrio subtropicus]
MSNTMTPQSLLNALPLFASNVTALLESLSIDASQLQADHLALRLNDQSVAEACFEQWLDYGERISAAVINGRPIWIIKLESPLQIGAWQVPCIELPFPSKKRYVNEGWEHIEFVIPGGATTLAQLQDDLQRLFPTHSLTPDALVSQGFEYKASQPEAEGEQLPNPTIAIKRQGICVKFHAHSIEAVVASEQSV